MKYKILCLFSLFLLTAVCLAESFDSLFDGLDNEAEWLNEDEVDILQNGGFDDLTDGLPDGWRKEMWNTDTGVSRLYVDPDGLDGACIVVENIDANDARFAQDVAVEPDTVYRISAMVCAEACDPEGIGATLSIGGQFCYSDTLYETGGRWEPIVFYGRTGADQTELTLYARLGGYGRETTGKVRFDNIEMTRVYGVPEGVEVHTFYQSESPEPETGKNDGIPERHTEMWLLCICLYALLVLAVLRRWAPDCIGENASVWLTVGMTLAIILRLIVSVRVRGYNTDINCFTAWSERIFNRGPLYFYSEDYFCDYPPGYMLLLWPVAAIRNLLKLPTDSRLYLLLLKLIPMTCDLLSAHVIWNTVKQRFGEKYALLPAMLYVLNPAVIVNSAAWGQIDAVLSLLIVLCALDAVCCRYTRALIWFSLALLIKPQALLFAPVGLAAMLFCIAAASKERRKKLIVRSLTGLAAALAILYIAAFLFTLRRSDLQGGVLLRPVIWLFDLYGGTMSGYRYVTVNSLNLYCLLGLNWAEGSAHPAILATAWGLFALSYLFAIALCVFLKRKPRRLITVGAILIVLVCTFGPMIHERYIFPALLLLTIACALEKDKRLWVSLTALTVTLFMNEILVLQGGMTEANYGHLQASENWLNNILCIVNIANAILLIRTGIDICLFDRVREYRFIKGNTAAIPPVSDHRLHLKRVDTLLMAGVTLVYALAAFINLGAAQAPQTDWTSSVSGESVVFDLGQTETYRMTYYGGICDSNFTVELSDDGEHWSDAVYAEYSQGVIFRWIWFSPKDADGITLREAPETAVAPVITPAEDSDYPMQTSRYIRVTAQSAGLTLYEIAFLDENGAPLPVTGVTSDGGTEYSVSPSLLIDEQSVVPEKPSYYNSTYFDEIYHARTAFEQLHHMNVYEWTHPPLGKTAMMLGIRLFGMTPFGWRFMGALTGVLMLPLMYLLVKQLTKDTALSFIGMTLMALDSMHFTQTRIATIDSYAVFWIMVMYLFMFRYIQMDRRNVSFRRTLIPLGLCGISMGIAWATKWIGLYASVGLAVLFFCSLFRRFRIDRNLKETLLTLLFCCVFFVMIPLAIYYFSYYWHLCGEGMTRFSQMFSLDRLKRVIQIQQNMFSYHAGLGGDTHYFRSPWYQWPVIYWPMWYYSGAEYIDAGHVSSISCMGNPAVWWFGLGALLYILFKVCWRRKTERTDTVTLVGFASQFMPWVLVPRSTFIYHYFASVPFIILCGTLALRDLRRKNHTAFKTAASALIMLALMLFIAFYPLESGAECLKSYAKYLRWFKWYNY